MGQVIGEVIICTYMVVLHPTIVLYTMENIYYSCAFESQHDYFV